MRKLLLFSCLASLGLVNAFNPRSYSQTIATCNAINREKDKDVKIDIHYVDVNPEASTTLIMVHGWPSLWSSWSNQIEEFKNDYRIIATNHRGFGSSTHPGDVESSGMMHDLVGDLTCVLKHAGVEKAVCIGHDWGAQVCWEAARQRPDIFEAVVALVVPYIPSAGQFIPIAALVPKLPRLAYQLFFQRNTSSAVAELDRDIRRTLRATLRDVATPPPEKFLTSTESFLYGYEEYETIPPIPFFTEDEEDYFVEQYSIQGFQNTLGFYTEGNRYGSYRFSNEQGNFTIPQPALAIYPTEDPVANWTEAAIILGSNKYLPKLHVETLPTAHWPQLERPKELNAILRKWLESLPTIAATTPGDAPPPVPEPEQTPVSTPEGDGHDEL